MLDVERLADGIHDAVEALIEARLAPVLARCAELEAKLAAPREMTVELNGLTEEEVRTIAREEIAQTEAIETVEFDIVEICDQVAAKLQKELDDAVAAIPPPEKGDPGANADMPALLAHIEGEVEKRIAALPIPKDGQDGVGVAGAVIDRDGALVVTLSDGKAIPLGKVVGKDGDPGDPGRDGFDLEDFGAELGEDGRTVMLSFTQGELKHSVELGFPAMVYRGVFKEGPYDRGDTVTWAGSLWHCDVDATTDKPGEESKAWTLATKRGRDGKDK